MILVSNEANIFVICCFLYFISQCHFRKEYFIVIEVCGTHFDLDIERLNLNSRLRRTVSKSCKCLCLFTKLCTVACCQIHRPFSCIAFLFTFILHYRSPVVFKLFFNLSIFSFWNLIMELFNLDSFKIIYAKCFKIIYVCTSGETISTLERVSYLAYGLNVSCSFMRYNI